MRLESCAFFPHRNKLATKRISVRYPSSLACATGKGSFTMTPPMTEPTYNDYLTDPLAREAIERAARNARALALQKHLFVPLARLCGRLTAVRGVSLRLDPRLA